MAAQPTPSSSHDFRRLASWTAILIEEHRIDGQLLLPGYRFVIKASKNEDGTIRLLDLVQALPLEKDRTYLIPPRKLRIGRAVSEGIKFVLEGLSVDKVNPNIHTDTGFDIQTQEPFGELFLNLALSLRVNAANLRHADYAHEPLRLLGDEMFEETFMSIYNSIPQEVKRILSSRVIDLRALPITDLSDRGVIDGDDQEVVDGLVVYLRMYLQASGETWREEEKQEENAVDEEMRKEINNADAEETVPTTTKETVDQDPSVRIYVGLTPSLPLCTSFRRADPHLGCVSSHHQSMARDAQEIRFIILCRPALPSVMSESAFYLAQQLFILFFDSYATFLHGTEATLGSPRHAQTQILREVSRVAVAQSFHQPIFPLKIEGVNLVSPLEWIIVEDFKDSFDKQSPPLQYASFWTHTRATDREIWRLNRLRTAKIEEQGNSMIVRIMMLSNGTDLKIKLPQEAREVFEHTSRRMAISIEAMRDWKLHSHPYARCSEAGPVSGITMANCVGVMVTGRDSSHRLRSFYCHITSPDTTASFIIEGRQITVPVGFVEMMCLLSDLTMNNFERWIPTRCSVSTITNVYERRFNLLNYSFDFVLWLQQGTLYFPTFEYVSHEQNWRRLLDEYGVSYENTGEACDLCRLRRQSWYASNTETNQDNLFNQRCNIINGVCEQWGWLNVPASWTNPERFNTDLKDLFFKQSAEGEVEMTSEQTDELALLFQTYDDESLERRAIRYAVSGDCDDDSFDEDVYELATKEEDCYR